MNEAKISGSLTHRDSSDSLGISSMVGNDTVVEEDGDFNPEWFRLSLNNSDFVENFLDIVKVQNTGGHGHQTGGQRFT